MDVKYFGRWPVTCTVAAMTRRSADGSDGRNDDLTPLVAGSDIPGEPRDGTLQMREALGAHLKELRRHSGRSLRKAATLSGLSPQFISLVERGQTEIGLSRLIRLADAYDSNIADLLSEIHGPEVEFVRAAAAFAAPRSKTDPKVTYLTSPSWQFQPFRIEIEPGSTLEALAHAGEEFIHCIAGTITMTVGGREWVLETYDTIVVPPRAPHSYRNRTNETAIAIGAVAPPSRLATGRDESAG
jgi:quercetin dioxygenase-like cupin family protein